MKQITFLVMLLIKSQSIISSIQFHDSFEIISRTNIKITFYFPETPEADLLRG